MVDALTLKGDEGRGLAAISFGEVPSNLRSEDVRMGQPPSPNFGYHLLYFTDMQTVKAHIENVNKWCSKLGLGLLL